MRNRTIGGALDPAKSLNPAWDTKGHGLACQRNRFALGNLLTTRV